MASIEAKSPRAAFIRLCLLLGGLSLLLWSCNLTGEKKVEHTLSFSKLYDSLSGFEKVVIVVKDPGGAWADTIFSGKVDSRAAIENLKSPNFHGDKVDIVIVGINGGKVVFEMDKKYDGATGKTDSTALVISAGTAVVSEAASLQVKEGETIALPGITVTPADLADKTLLWTSSDTSTFSVAGSGISGKKAGEATLTAKLNSDPSKGVDIAVTVTAKVPPVDTPKPPPAPVIASLIAGDTKIILSWNTVVGAESYNIFYGEGASVDLASTRIKGITSPFEVGGLRNGALYAFALTAVNTAGESDLGAAQTATPQIPAVSAPIITTVMAGVGKVTLTWGPVAGSTGYTLYYRIGSTVDKAGGIKVASVSSPHELSGLSANTLYAFAVASQSAAGESGLSNVTTAKTFPDAPTDLVYKVNPAVYFAGVAIIENTMTVNGAVDSFMVTPALPAGLSLNKATGAVSGTPTSAAAGTGYEVTALNQSGSAKATLNITVNGAPTGLVYAQNPANYWKDVAITANTAAISGVVDSFSVAPALPAGLTLDKATGAVTGKPTAASTAESYTVTAHSRAGNSTAPLAITVNGPPSGLTYAQNPAAYYQTVAITTNAAAVSGLVDSFTVAPALPAGLTLDKATGAITGTPTVVAASAEYTVTARNPAGTATVQLALAVNGAPTGLSYSANPAAYWKGVAITANTASISGSVDSFTVSPALPAGLAISKATGSITGTPTTPAGSASYTVTARNPAGAATVQVTILVNGPPTGLTYSSNPATYWRSLAIATNSATVGGTVDSFTVSPALPAGLAIGKATGAITGTPTAATASAVYTVKAWNKAGSTTVGVTMLVNGPPSGLAYSTNPASYVKNQAISQNSASVTGVVDSFTVSPALPSGLALNKTTGAVTGTPTASAASAAYTVKAWNKAGTTTVSLNLAVTGTVLEVAKDITLDTTSGNYNTGYTGSMPFGYPPSANLFTMFQWDLSGVSTAGLTSAKAVFKTYGYGSEWNGTAVTFKVHLYRLKSAWLEGTGNWYWNRDAWQNSGEGLYTNYTPSFPDYVRTGSVDPANLTGVSNWNRDLVKQENLIEMATQDITVSFSGASVVPSWGPPFPASENLIDLEMDLTEYVMAVAGGTDYGVIIMLEGSSITKQVNLMTKEIGDGTLGAKLHLNY